LLAQSSTLKGIVKDLNNEPMVGATVLLNGTNKGAKTKKDGSFEIQNIEPKSYYLVVKLIGYEEYRELIPIKAGIEEVTIKLKESSVLLNSVEVTSSRRVQKQDDTRTSVITLDPKEAKFKAGAAEDVLRSLQSFPGVVAANDFSSQLIIRGSGPDQNLILLDNIEVFNPYRLYGFISMFNPETVSGITLLTGGFGAKYSDRLSAVLDVTNREGARDKGYFATKANVSVTNANIVTEGKLPMWNGSWIVSGRRTYYDLIVGPVIKATGAVEGDVALPNFGDVQAKIALQPTSELKILVNAIFSRDNTEFLSAANRPQADSFSIIDNSFNDLVGTTFIYTPFKDFASTTSFSWYKNRGSNNFGGIGGSQFVTGERDISQEDLRNLQDSLRNAGVDIPTLFSINGRTNFSFQKWSMKNDQIWNLGANTLEFGVLIDWLTTGVGFAIDIDPRLRALQAANPRIPPLPESFDNNVSYLRLGSYVQNSYRATKDVTVTGGLRFDYFGLINKAYLSPRFSFSYAVDPISTVRGAWGVYYQSPGYEKLFDQQVFIDFTSPNLPNLRAERAMHYVLGYERLLTPEWQFKVEGYYKSFNDLILQEVLQGTVYSSERIPGTDSTKREGWTTPVASIGDSVTVTPINIATGEAYGIEFMLQKIQSIGENKLYGWVSYSFAVANRYRNNLVIPFNFDRRHTLNVVGGWKVSESFDVNFTWTFGTGFPWTRANGIRPRIVQVTDTITGQKEAKLDQDWRGLIFDVDRGGNENLNQARLPNYHRLDVRATTYANWFGQKWSFYLDIVNVYNNVNIISENYRVDRETLQLQTREVGMLPILPTLGFSVEL
jgi:outer membrane receptor protein involved in Fe transport